MEEDKAEQCGEEESTVNTLDDNEWRDGMGAQ